MDNIVVVAELGANWKGNVEILERMVTRCKWAGVDYVKFQALSDQLLARHPEWDWYKHASVTPENIDTIDKICSKLGIRWFCTPSYAQSVDFLDPYVPMWKIHHAGRLNTEIIDKCLNTGKEIIVSTDRKIYDYDIFAQIHQIYCIPKYPTDYGELNFDMIKILPGYSNHCLDPLAILKAVRYGAKYIEFHLSDNLDEFAIDNKVSMSYAQMDEFMRWIRLYEKDGVLIRAR